MIDDRWQEPDATFWSGWKRRKMQMIEESYSVKKTKSGKWLARLRPRSSELPIRAPEDRSGLFVPSDMKASLCLDCGDMILIAAADQHRPCAVCGA